MENQQLEHSNCFFLNKIKKIDFDLKNSTTNQ